MASVISDLEERLDTLLESTESIRTEIKRENKKRDVRIRANRVATFAAIVAAVVGIFVGGVGVDSAHNAAASARQANRAAAVINTNNSVSRKASCDNQVASATITRKGQKDQIRVLVGALLATSPEPITPQGKQKVEAFYKTYDDTVDRDNPLRDCTPRGIACNLKLTPPQGTKPCDGYKGFLPG